MQDDSEGRKNPGAEVAQPSQQDPYEREQHRAVPDVVKATAAAVAIKQAATARDGPAREDTPSYTALHGKWSAPVDASLGGGIAVELPAFTNNDASLARKTLYPATDVQTVGSSSAWTTLPLSPQAAPQRPGEGATVKERLVYIGKQLDAFGRRGVILKQFEMLGGDDRCIGGAFLRCKE